MTSKHVYITQTTDIGGKTYNSGSLHEFDAAEAEAIIASGQAEATSFAAIDNITAEADAIADRYKAKRTELLESARYETNEGERTHLLNILEEETLKAIKDVEFSHSAEILASKQFAATSALQPIGTPEQQQQANATADAIQTQLLIAESPGVVVEMLRLSSEGYDDPTKIAILSILPQIKAKAGSAHAGTIQAIEKDLRKFSGATDNHRTLRHLKAYEASEPQVARKYHQAKKFQRGDI